MALKSYALQPLLILVQPVGISVQNGGTAVFTVAYLGVLPTATWQYNGKAVSTSSNVTIATGSTNLLVGGILQLVPISVLTVKNITATNGGNYSVVIKDVLGETKTSANANLVVLSSTVTNVVNVVTTGLGMTASGFKLQLSGPTGSNVVVEASTDLTHWTPIATNLVASGGISVTDTLAKNYPSRYYRAHTK